MRKKVYTRIVDTKNGISRIKKRGRCIHLTDKTQILTVRIPRETKAALSGVDMRRFLENVGELYSNGRVEIVNSRLVVPEINCDECEPKKVYEEVKDIAHDKNLSVRDFLRMARRG